MLAPCALATIGAIASLTYGTQAQSQSTIVTAEGAVLKEVSAEFAFTEGPSTDAQGNVFFTDQPNDRIVRWDATTGALTDWLKPSGRSNGTFISRYLKVPEGSFLRYLTVPVGFNGCNLRELGPNPGRSFT